jgi:hypothetical protein
MSQAGKDGTFQPVPEAQAQNLPGYVTQSCLQQNTNLLQNRKEYEPY